MSDTDTNPDIAIDDDSGIDEDAPAPRRRGKKLFVILGGLVVLGGGVGGGLYAAGIVGHGSAAAEDGKPKLVPKSEQKRAGDGKDEGGHGGSEEKAESHGGKPTPAGQGGEKFASNYYSFAKEFTSNLSDSDRFVQIGVAISTPYDDTVIEHIKTNEIAVRSAVLMALGDTGEDQISSEAGKRQLQVRLVKAINATLQEKEGFGGVSNVYFTNFVVQ